MTTVDPARVAEITAQVEQNGSEPDVGSEIALEKFRSNLRTPEQVKALPKPVWLVSGVLVESTLAIVWGTWGTCKTFLSLDWAGHVGSGAWWHGREVIERKVLYIAGEGVAGLGKRIDAWERWNHIYGMPGVAFHHGRINLLDRSQADGFTRGVVEGDYGLVFVDTLARCMPDGDENSARDVGLVTDVLDTVRRESGATVTVIHHATKEGSSARGISAFLGACDTELQVTASGAAVTVKFLQQRDSEIGEPIRLRLNAVLATDSAVLVDDHEPAEGEDLTGFRREVLRALVSVMVPEGVSTRVWFSATEGVAERTFYRARSTLVTKGLVGSKGQGHSTRYTLTEQAKQALES